METSLVPLAETMSLGRVLAESGFFQDARSEAQAVVKVLAGRELGFGPVASMTGIYIVKGKPSLSANLMAAAIKRSGRYDYRVREMTPTVCKIEFFEKIGGKSESIGVSEFTADDARKAETQNMNKFPRNMLFARAMSNGVRWFCPDVTGGPVYTPEELGANVDEDGDVIDVPHVVVSETPKGNGHNTEPPPDESGGPAGAKAAQETSKAEQPAKPHNVKAKLVGGGFNDALMALIEKLDNAGVSHDYRKRDGGIDYDHAQYTAGSEGFTEITRANMADVIAAIERHVMAKAGAPA